MTQFESYYLAYFMLTALWITTGLAALTTACGLVFWCLGLPNRDLTRQEKVLSSRAAIWGLVTLLVSIPSLCVLYAMWGHWVNATFS